MTSTLSMLVARNTAHNIPTILRHKFICKEFLVLFMTETLMHLYQDKGFSVASACTSNYRATCTTVV